MRFLRSCSTTWLTRCLQILDRALAHHVAATFQAVRPFASWVLFCSLTIFLRSAPMYILDEIVRRSLASTRLAATDPDLHRMLRSTFLIVRSIFQLLSLDFRS